jgi:site-specific DNA-methyltransferase (adenine-specific)
MTVLSLADSLERQAQLTSSFEASPWKIDQMAYSVSRKHFKVIYADPPWQYRDKANAGKRGAVHKYDVMTPSQIAALDVQGLADPSGCVLFLWTTFPQMPVALATIKSWGFTYKTIGFVWVKQNKVADSLFMGCGHYTRSNPEPCLIAVRGRKPKRLHNGVHSVIIDRIRKHSQKPDVARTRIEQLFGNVPRVELFARNASLGWDIWGNEVESSIELGVKDVRG